ncbi:MAG: PilN domain-containing protein, partial [Candidatus Omnitrophica bacterium]|nr:PilN domain-containing protein [Candidatus Omnitrophota bacterium]
LAPELELLRDQNFAKRVLSGEPYWEDVFKELSRAVPGTVYLTELNFENGALALEGVIVSAENERVLSDFMLALEKGIFKNVQLVSSKDIQGMSKSTFELKGGFD